jgi:hypothetical protein
MTLRPPLVAPGDGRGGEDPNPFAQVDRPEITGIAGSNC